MNSHRTEPGNLLEELLEAASGRARDILAAPGSAARLRQLGSDDLSEIQRLETSPFAEDQLVAVGLRLAGSRTMRSDVTEHLKSYFGSPSSSLEIEAQRRSIWQINRSEAVPTAEAEAASRKIEQRIRDRGLTVAQELPRWAALYADLWCDPRLGASARARRVMLAMVTLMHERAQALAQVALAAPAPSTARPTAPPAALLER